jgi:hypothetical protein
MIADARITNEAALDLVVILPHHPANLANSMIFPTAPVKGGVKPDQWLFYCVFADPF